MIRRKVKNRAVAALLLSLMLSLPCLAQDKGENLPEAKAINRAEILRQIFGDQNLYIYHREERSDPFMPFIRERTIEQDMLPKGEEIPPEELTGLRKFEPGQLSLVAVISKKDGPIAMVQDPVGKGYVIKRGTKIGRYGVVEDIEGNMVIVKQATRATWTQEKLFKRVEMVLRKEGEQ